MSLLAHMKEGSHSVTVHLNVDDLHITNVASPTGTAV